MFFWWMQNKKNQTYFNSINGMAAIPQRTVCFSSFPSPLKKLYIRQLPIKNFKRKEKIWKQSTQACKRIKSKRASKKVFLPQVVISNSGSITVEAALVVPLCIFFLYLMLSLGMSYITEQRVHEALVQTARTLAKETAMEEGKAVFFVRAGLLFRQYCTVNSARIRGGIQGISFWNSEQRNSSQEVVLRVSYQITIFVPLFGTRNIQVKDEVRHRIYDGYHPRNKEELPDGYVYMTEQGEVYHTDPNCRYLAIKSVPVTEEASYRGKRNCRLCRDHPLTGRYITIAGDCVHRDAGCSAIYRSVRLVKKDKVQDRTLCSVCAGVRK